MTGAQAYPLAIVVAVANPSTRESIARLNVVADKLGNVLS